MPYLEHHGIKGMRWGVRRYQNKDGTLTAAGRERYSENNREEKKTDFKRLSHGESLVNKFKNRSVSSMNDYVVGGDMVVTAMAGLTALTALGINVAASKVAQKILTVRKIKELDSRYTTRDIKDFKSAPRIKSKEPTEEAIKKTNPGYPGKGRTQNCTFCTTALALRELGYDVVADETRDGWPAEELFQKIYNSPTIKMNKRQTKTELVNTLSGLGKNAYGNLTVRWKLGGGHSVFWKNVNGKTHIYDGQSGTEYDVSDPETSKFLSSINLRKVDYNRFDNVTPTKYALSIVKKRG